MISMDAKMSRTQKPVTVRFAMGDYIDIAREAEAQNTTSADIVRKAWKNYQESKNMTLKLAQFERRMLLNTFEICTATVGLTSIERKKAAQQVNNHIGKELIK